MKNNNYTHKLEKLIHQYGMAKPAPESMRKYVTSTHLKKFRVLMKRSVKYTAITGIIIWLLYFFKKIFSGISITKLLISVVAVSTAIPGGYIAYNYFVDKYNENANINEISIKEPAKTTKRTGSKIFIPGDLLGIHPMESSTIDKKFINIVNKDISSGLLKTGIQRTYDFIKKDSIKKFRYAVFNTSEKIGDAIILNVKVFNVKTSSIVYSKNVEVSSYGDLARESVETYREIISKLGEKP